MKKKVLSFILAICLIIPCMFMMTACGKDESKTLAGKTIRCSGFYTDFDFNSHSIDLNYVQEGGNGNKFYTTNVTLGEILEMTLGTNAFTYLNNATPTTFDEAKELFVQKLKSKLCTVSVNPYIHFSEDLTKADLYYTAETVARTYDVEYVSNLGYGTYTLKLDGKNCVELYAQDSDHDKFRIAELAIDGYGSVDGYHFIKQTCEVGLEGECATPITLTADDGSTIQKRLDEVFVHNTTIWVTLLYTVI